MYPALGAQSTAYRPPVNAGPNPTVAGILGAIPLGLGAVYCGQYAKGLAHLGIFVGAIIALSSDLSWQADTVLGIFLGFFWVYQILDAVRTARAIQANEPVPDPFGLTSAFGTGEKLETTKVPAAAAILIGLGVLFLLHTAGLFSIDVVHFVSLILIVLGVWLFAKHWGLLGTYHPTCVCERCKTSKLMGPAILVTLGVVFLIGFFKAWPAILLVIGAVKLMQSNASTTGHIGPLPPGAIWLSAKRGSPSTAATGAAESGAACFFWRGEKCLAQLHHLPHFLRFLHCRRGVTGRWLARSS